MFCFGFWEKVLHIPGWPWTPGPSPFTSQCWDSRCAPLCLASLKDLDLQSLLPVWMICQHWARSARHAMDTGWDATALLERGRGWGVLSLTSLYCFLSTGKISCCPLAHVPCHFLYWRNSCLCLYKLRMWVSEWRELCAPKGEVCFFMEVGGILICNSIWYSKRKHYLGLEGWLSG